MSPYREINLIPEDILLRDQAIQRAWVWTLVICLVVVLLGGLYMVARKNHGAVEQVIADLARKNAEIEEKVRQLSLLQEEWNNLARRERAIHALLYKRSVSGLFAEMADVMNDRVWLTSLTYQDRTAGEGGKGKAGPESAGTSAGYIIIKNSPPAGREGAGKSSSPRTLLLEGIAVSNDELADFLEGMTTEPAFADVELRYVRKLSGGSGRGVAFEVEGILSGEGINGS